MSQAVINTLINELVKIVISDVNNRQNSHILLARELKTINSNSFSNENKTLKLDIQTYLSDLVKLVQELVKLNGTNPDDYITKVGDKDTSFNTNYFPKLNNLYTKVNATTGDYSKKIDLGDINYVRHAITIISTKLKAIKNAANQLQNAKANQQPSTTPPAVANGSVKDVDDLVREYNDNDYKNFSNVNNDLSTNYNELSVPTKESDITEFNNILTNRTKHIALINKYKNDILKSKDTNGTTYTEEDINKSIEGLNKDISILKTLIAKKKGNKTDNQVNTSPPPTNTETNQTTTTESTTPTNEKTSTETTTPQIPQLNELPVDQWGIRFTTKQLEVAANQSPFSTYYMSLLPARQSTVPIQGGRDVPNAMPGLNFKFVPAIGKQQIPGFSPIYQNLGIKGLQVIIVGAFTGADGEEKTVVDEPKTFGSNRFSSTLGGMTIADNPFREPKAELNAYNSYLAFQKLAYEGKQIEVEINTAQVYKDYAPSPHAETLKLQDPTSGNPQFTAVIKNLDVYHATQERTWYTLVLDVTNFNMASKENINLNVSLQEAITQAQKDMENKKGQEGPNQESATEGDSESSLNSIEELADVSKTIESIPDKIAKITDTTKRKHQAEIYEHFLNMVKLAQKSPNRNINKYQGKELFSQFLSSLNGEFTDITANFIGNEKVLFRTRFDCRVFAGIPGLCRSELYWLLDPNNTDKPITKFLGKGIEQGFSVTEGLPNYTRKTVDGIGPHSYLDGTISDLNKLKDSQSGGRLTQEEWARLGSEVLGCIIDTSISAKFFGAGGIAVSLAYCGLSGVSTMWELYDNINQNDPNWVSSVALDFALGRLVNIGLGAASKFLGNKVSKQGSPIRGSKAVSPTVVNSVDDLLTKLEALPDKNVLIGQEVSIIKNNVSRNVKITQVTSNGDVTLLTADDGVIYTLDEIRDVPASVFTQPTVTPNSPNSPSTPTQNPSVSKIDDSINRRVANNDLKNYLLGLSQDQKIIALKALDQATLMNPNQILEVKLKDGSTIVYNSKPRIGSQGNISTNANDIINVKDIESSSLKLKSTPTPPQQPTNTPTKQPTQQLTENSVPENQSSKSGTSNPTSSSTKQPIPKLNSYSETAIYESISDKIGVEFKESDNLILTLTNGNKYNLKQLNYDTNTEEFVITYFSSPAFPKPGVAKIKPKSLAYLQKGQTIISNVSKISDPSKINNFLNNLKSSEVIGFQVKGADITNIQVTDLKFIPKNSIPLIVQDSLNYKMKFKLSSGEIIEVDRYAREFSIEKYSQNSNLPKVREVKKVTATTIRKGYSRLITDKTEMITYLQNNQGTIIPYEGLENPGLLKLENFNETTNNPLNKYFLVKQINNTNQYVIQFIDDTGSRPSPNRSVMTLENFVKFIEGFSAK